MVEPVSIATGVAKAVGPRVAKEVMRWARGSEARQLVNLLKKDHPGAPHLLLQPDALGELWFYAETGELDYDAMLAAVRPVTKSDEEAEALVEAIRTTQWRALRDERRSHFEFLRLRQEIKSDMENASVLARIEAALGGFRCALPVARQLPAQISPFVDRDREIAEGEKALEARPDRHVALVLCCSGMPGVGKSAFALELAHQRAARFDGGWLYVDMRLPGGGHRGPADIAVRLLLDLGVAPEVIPPEQDARMALLRSVLALEPVLLVLDNARNENQVRDLIPPNPDSVVIITSRTPLGGLGSASLIDLEEMGEAEAVAVLGALIGQRVAAEPNAAAQIVRSCGGLPLALAVLGGRARKRPHEPLSAFVAAVTPAADAVGALDDPAGTLRAALQTAIEAASTGARRLFLLLAALEVVSIEPEVAGAVTGEDAVRARQLLEELGAERLLTSVAGGTWRMHHLLRLVAASMARDELGDELTSAQERRVEWLTNSAQMHFEDLEGEV
ncbi:MAG: NB-ARC domain-containing protein [Solirubrobacteraceae bacterium]